MTTAARLAALPLLLALSTAGAQGAVAIPRPDAARLDGRDYHIELRHDVGVESPEGRREIGRALRLRVRALAEPVQGGTRQVALRIDSIRASATTPHARELVDTRRHRGARVVVRVAAADGASTVQGAPTVDFASVGGELPLASLLALVVAPVPGGALRVGQAVERAWPRQSIDGNTASDRPVTARLTLRAVAGRGADRVARIEIATRAAATADAGAIEGRGMALVEVATGVLRELSLDETTSGTYRFGDGLPYRQATTVRIARAEAAR
jgi:hypothetical protein